jgi:hypothetical protein
MSTMPKTPAEQRNLGSEDPDVVPPDRRDRTAGLQSGDPGDADANLNEQGRFGNLHQNLTNKNKSGRG